MALAPPGHRPDWDSLQLLLLFGYIQGGLTLEDLERLLGPHRVVRLPKPVVRPSNRPRPASQDES